MCVYIYVCVRERERESVYGRKKSMRVCVAGCEDDEWGMIDEQEDRECAKYIDHVSLTLAAV